MEKGLNASTQYFLDPHYYLELLPTSLQSLKDQPEEFKQQLLSHFTNLTSKFEKSLKRTHAGNDWLFYTMGKTLAMAEYGPEVWSSSYGWNSFVYTGYNSAVHEDELSSTYVVPGITMTNEAGQPVDEETYYSRDFLGFSLYLGKTPPPHKDHIFIYKFS
ncbi:hypothetical protein [Candidatus Odyssella thessalonicensis]|uniref:hypothetical protein n=1 Tax=Candidatus Odyssella thessalonicensis TaxID=84647 RepID=UPI000225BC8F|nr:hypothetical protein [Candidatus Odyssella thessalonicensis]